MAGVNHQLFIVRLVNEDVPQSIPDALVPPAAEPTLDILPVAQVRRQITPGAPVRKIKNMALDKQSIIFGNPASDAFAPRYMRLQQFPRPVGYVASSMRCVHAHPPSVQHESTSILIS